MTDRRVRLRPKSGGESYVYGDVGGGSSTAGLLTVLRETGGMVWTTTPQINEAHSVMYDSESPIQSNAVFSSFKSNTNAILNVTGSFHSSTPNEAYYTLACIHFLRSVTKMDSGRIATEITNTQVAVPGAPPPVLLFSGYGDFMFGDIPVIVKSFNMTFPEDVDYVEVPIASDASSFQTKLGKLTRLSGTAVSNKTWVPTKMNITVSLEVQPNPDWMSKTFNLNDFKRGALIKNRRII